jgi:glycine cleavage system H protein
MNIPADLKYAKTDEWIKVEGNVATIGVSDYAQEQLSDVVYVEISVSVGATVQKGKIIATVESVKAAATPELINSDPYSKAWMIKVELSDVKELDSLLDADAYEKHNQERSH